MTREGAAALVVVLLSSALFLLASYIASVYGAAQLGASYIISEYVSAVNFVPRSYEALNVIAKTKTEVLCDLQANSSGLELLVLPMGQLSNLTSGGEVTPIVNYTASGDYLIVPGNVTFGPGNYTVVIFNPHSRPVQAYVLSPCEVRPYVRWW